MRLLGFLLLVAGWVIVVAAVMLLALATPRTGFVLAGTAVELLGLVLMVRSHVPAHGERR